MEPWGRLAMSQENLHQRRGERDFPGGSVVGTTPSNMGDRGSVSPIWGVGILHASWPNNQSIKQKQRCNKPNKDFKNDPHQKIERERGEGERPQDLCCMSINILLFLSFSSQRRKLQGEDAELEWRSHKSLDLILVSQPALEQLKNYRAKEEFNLWPC